jgi:DnaJ-class molecular chaperone
MKFVNISIVEDKRRKYDQLGRAGLSNGHGNSGYSSNGGYSRFSEDFLNRTFHFHNPFDIFEQFMSHFGMDDDLSKFILSLFKRNEML